MQYRDKMFIIPEQSEQLKVELKRKMKNYDAAKSKIKKGHCVGCLKEVINRQNVVLDD